MNNALPEVAATAVKSGRCPKCNGMLSQVDTPREGEPNELETPYYCDDCDTGYSVVYGYIGVRESDDDGMGQDCTKE